MAKLLAGALFATFFTFTGAVAQDAESKAEDWRGPFGGSFSTNFTVASEYNYAGISNSMGQPAYQFGMSYRTPNLFDGPPIWFHVHTWSSNVRFAAVGEAFEVDLGVGIKTQLIDGRLKLDFGWIRYFYPGTPAELGYEYSELAFTADYDFGPIYVSARIRQSDNFFGQSGQSWNKRLRIGVPLDFLGHLGGISLEAYGSFGNFWVDNFIRDGLPGNEYNYWQVGFTALALGLEFHVAYVGTDISYQGCAYTTYCADRVFFSVTKSF